MSSARMALLISLTALLGTLGVSNQATGAPAANPVPTDHVLHPYATVYDPSDPNPDFTRAPKYDGIWTSAVPTDSPRDKNSKALYAHIPADTTHKSYWVQADTFASTHHLRHVGVVKNLSFDYYSPRVATKHWRRPLMFASTYRDFEFVFDPKTCSHPLGSGWMRTDITGFVHNCSFRAYKFNSNDFSTYAANGKRSAWQQFTHRHPDLRLFGGGVLYLSPGGYYAIDRLSLSTGYEYNRSNTEARKCRGSEARC
jgi:hypothetical protein